MVRTQDTKYVRRKPSIKSPKPTNKEGKGKPHRNIVAMIVALVNTI